MFNAIGNLLDDIGGDRRFVEPFAGSAALSFALGRPGTLINDLNRDLMILYTRIKTGDWPDESLAVLENHPTLRDEYNASTDHWRRAELFYALSRVSFNGLIRFNGDGEFNSSKGDRVSPAKPLKDYQAMMVDWQIMSVDYRDLPIESNDLVFADPPYDTPFNSYQGSWDWQEHIDCARYWSQFPAIVTNQATDRILKLYRGLGYTVAGILAPRRIAGNGNRVKALEMIALSPKLPPQLIRHFPNRVELDQNIGAG